MPAHWRANCDSERKIMLPSQRQFAAMALRKSANRTDSSRGELSGAADPGRLLRVAQLAREPMLALS